MTNSADEDPFDRLPDDVVLSIFDRLQDARSLCLSMAVCTRFRAIAPLVFHIFLPVPSRKPAPPRQPHRRTASLRCLIAGALTRPLQFISRMIRPVSRDAVEKIGDLEYYSRRLPGLILPHFHQIRVLRLRLPCNGCHKLEPEPSKSGGHEALLKWTADFGREIRGCVVLGARRWSPVGGGLSGLSDTEGRSLGDDELKLRIVWTISCLIAASTRHYLVQETVRGLERVEHVEITDESGQGRLWMGGDGVSELKGAVALEHRGRLPALRMRMWFLERAEAAGMMMEGGTLVVVRPAAAGGSDVDMVAAFSGDEAVEEAARKLMGSKRCYTLEMNSF
ncbi:Unknown protein [Striga hermonthica]|uniref:F-box domain-containing protein n=1 Tax=Striga hermonthica TaxID=68872 RepID=A0A9N7RJM8_STRHE|nr:Unknown protein [Striga hermonthica]